MSLTVTSLNIRADFDSGNIDVLDSSDHQDVRLAIRPDTRSPHFQWFYFKAEGLTPGAEHTFHLSNAGQSSYSHAWHGYNAVASYDQQDWFRVPSRFDGQTLSFTLTAEQPQAWFAYFEPYSRERHAGLVDLAEGPARLERLATGHSVEGREIPLWRKGDGAPGKRRIWIIAQQHPGEHMAEWFMEGIIEQLRTPSSELQGLLAAADLYLVPNMNPDGATRGHLRTNANGKDLNRAWRDTREEDTPEVWFVRQAMERYGVDMFLDVHGDEEIPYVFTAACEGNPGYTEQQKNLEADFRERLSDLTRDFQTRYGYPRGAPGKANMTLACNSVGERFKCLALTLEMPFKDNDDAPDARTGWSGKRSKALARDVLTTLARMVHTLR